MFLFVAVAGFYGNSLDVFAEGTADNLHSQTKIYNSNNADKRRMVISSGNKKSGDFFVVLLLCCRDRLSFDMLFDISAPKICEKYFKENLRQNA